MKSAVKYLVLFLYVRGKSITILKKMDVFKLRLEYMDNIKKATTSTDLW